MSEEHVLTIPTWEHFINGDVTTGEKLMLIAAMGLLTNMMDAEAEEVWSTLLSVSAAAIEELNAEEG